jgi:hypothetical protein
MITGVFAGQINNNNNTPPFRPGHMLRPMSPRTCQEYLSQIRENEQNRKKIPSSEKPPLHLSNERICLRSSSDTTKK